MEGVGGSGKYEERRSLGGVNKRCEVEGLRGRKGKRKGEGEGDGKEGRGEGRGGRGGRKWGSIGYRRQKSGEGCEGY